MLQHGAPPRIPALAARSRIATACRPTRASRRAAVAASRWAAEPVLVSGAGIAGLSAALALSKVGIPVRVLEAASNLREEGAAIGLWANAWGALDALGVADTLRKDYLQLNRVELCTSDGQLLRGFGMDECGVARTEFRGVRRVALLQALYDALPDRERLVTFNAAVEEVLQDGGSSGGAAGGGGAAGQGIVVRLRDGRTVHGSVLVGADGVRSAVARHLGLQRPRYSGYIACRGVAELPVGRVAALNTIRQIWGAGVRAGLYPLSPTQVYWFACWNADEAAASAPPPPPAERQAAALRAVRGWAWGMEQLVRQTPPEGISWSPITDRWTAGAVGRGAVTLAGDAAHPMTPNLGQGGCVALEDAVALARALAGAAEEGGDAAALAACLRLYEAERSSRCLPLTVRSHLMGAALQIPLPLVCAVRNAFVKGAFRPSHFLDHTAYDCGALPAAVAAPATAAAS